VKKGESTPENWVYEKAENFSKGLMIVGAITGRGVLPLIRVPPKAKINSEYYIKYVLKRLLEKELPKLYPGEVNKVFVHHDKASSHISIKTSEYSADLKARTGISIIDNQGGEDELIIEAGIFYKFETVQEVMNKIKKELNLQINNSVSTINPRL
jgi:hypothetical protein